MAKASLPCSCFMKELLYLHSVGSNSLSSKIFGTDFSEDLE